MKIKTTELTRISFAPYGQVLMSESREPEYNSWAGRLDSHRESARLNITYMSMRPSCYPAMMGELERHPYSNQMFVPLEGTCHLVVVCHSLPEGKPDLNTLRAFHATGAQTVIYAANVWHTPRTVLNHSGAFIMMRWDEGTSEDTEFFQLDAPLEIVFPRP